jgi:hypothetical protein
MSTLTRTARITGLAYLGLALTGGIGFLAVRAQLAADTGAQTLANLQANPGLANLGITLEFATVVFQAIAAVYFAQLFHSTHRFAGFSIAAFGLMNSVAILGSATFLATAAAVARDSSLAPSGDAAATVQLSYNIADNFWGAGALFFGLWLIPMGYAACRSLLMPSVLGRILVLGGVGYVASAMLTYGLPDAPAWVANTLAAPATVGELWMIGYLLVVGVNRRTAGRLAASSEKMVTTP